MRQDWHGESLEPAGSQSIGGGGGFDGAIAWEITTRAGSDTVGASVFAARVTQKAGRVGRSGEVEVRMGCSVEWWCDVWMTERW
jgi:hypothetical protein